MNPDEPTFEQAEIQAVLGARHQNVFAFLGAHDVGGGKQVVRTVQPYARGGCHRRRPAVVAEKLHEDGFFEAVTPAGSTNWKSPRTKG
jgi:hypothetical protein